MGCTWGGLGEVAGKKTWENQHGIRNPGIRLHELGHNLGWHHAGTQTMSGDRFGSNYCEYCDDSDPMGGALQVTSNAPHRYTMGWLPDRSVLRCEMGECATRKFQLRDLNTDDSTLAAGQYTVATVTVPSQGNRHLTISYRSGQGADTGLL